MGTWNVCEEESSKYVNRARTWHRNLTNILVFTCWLLFDLPFYLFPYCYQIFDIPNNAVASNLEA